MQGKICCLQGVIRPMRGEAGVFIRRSALQRTVEARADLVFSAVIGAGAEMTAPTGLDTIATNRHIPEQSLAQGNSGRFVFDKIA